MKLSLETVARLWAAGRNYANLFIGFGVSLGLVSVAQSKTLSESLNEIWTGLSQVVHGLTSIWQVLVIIGGPAVTAVLAWYAQRSAKTVNQAVAVKAAVVDPNTPISPETKTAIVAAAKEVTKS